ncbi:asparagine synthase (glutamine-hydrolyzing) [Spirillospora sp. NPDC127200]
MLSGVCGIGGVISADPAWSAPEAMLAAMDRRLRHRGPDDSRTARMPGGALISRRLAILDPEHSRQPLTDCSGAVTVVYNGEIYNYRELRRELDAAGHVFRTNGDGEVIPHLYETYGAAFPRRLRGAFAIAVYDHRADRLVLARDRLGEKPLVYAVADDRFFFASEMRAIVPWTGGRISAAAIDQYLHYGYVLEPSTVFANIAKVPAGTVMVLDRSAPFEPRITEYWSAPALEEGDGPVAAMAEGFATAVAQQLNADVPTAVALSDGVDSTLMAETAARCVPRLRTYNVVFGWMPDVPEAAVPSATARRIGAAHTVVELSPERYAALLAEGAAGLSEPIADWTMPAYLGMTDRCRQDGVRVLLTGHGPDELFLAYDWARAALRSLGGGGTDGGSPRHDAYLFNPEYREARIFAEIVLEDRAARKGGTAFTAPLVRTGNRTRSDLRQQLAAGYLRSNGLLQLDALGLRKEVEVRLPYVDHRFVEAAIRADQRVTPDQGNPKSLLYEMGTALGIDLPVIPKRPFFPKLKGVDTLVTALAGSALPAGALAGGGAVSQRGVTRLLDTVKGTGAGLTVMYRLLVLELWLRSLGKPVGGPQP